MVYLLNSKAMKKDETKTLVSFLLMLTLLLSCNKTIETNTVEVKADQIIDSYLNPSHHNDSDYKCMQITDAIVYPVPWTQEKAKTFSISEDTLQNMSTCGLIQTYINQPWNSLGPWCTICSNSTMNGMDYFNNKIANNTVAVELFTRADVVEKSLIRYINYMKNLESIVDNPGTLYSFELLLASKQFNDLLTKKVSSQLLILAMKMIHKKKEHAKFKNIQSLAVTRHIMLNILLKLNPDLISKKSFKVGVFGYKICYENGKIEALVLQHLNLTDD